MGIFKDDEVPKGFDKPTDLPSSEVEAVEWQKANRAWWEKHPMRYDWRERVPFREFSREFFEDVDRRFFSDAREYLRPWKEPFDEFVDFDSLKDKDVLEIGVGNGSHAQLLSRHARSFTGIDLTSYASKSTSERFKVFGLKGNILQMDAERLVFPDRSFDFVWSWGVIHASSDTKKIVREIHRVLHPKGEAVIMVYYRGWWNYYVVGVLRGIVSGMLFKGRSLHEIKQLNTDGAIGRYYTAGELAELGNGFFTTEDVGAFGPKTDFVFLPPGKVKELVKRLIPNAIARFFTHTLKMGCFLVVRYKKSA